MAGAVRVDCAVVLESTLVSLVPVSLVVVDAASLVPQSSLCRWLRLAGNLPIEWRVRVPAYITWTLREKEREREREYRDSTRQSQQPESTDALRLGACAFACTHCYYLPVLMLPQLKSSITLSLPFAMMVVAVVL